MKREKKMYALIQAWNESDLTRKEFAQQSGISVSTLDKWRVRFANEPATHAQTSDSKPEFIELQLPDTGKNKNPTPKVRLELPHGIVLKIY